MRRSRSGVTRPALSAMALATIASAAFAGVDGQEIAFHTTRDGKFEIYLRCTDGREVNLTNHPAQDYGLSWSPDGARFAFATKRDGDEEIYLHDLASGAVENLTRSPGVDTQPAWSPDGARLAFFSERGAPAGGDPSDSRDLYLVELATKEVRRITSNALYEESPSWTSDGRAIVFCRMRPASAGSASACDLWSVAVDGGAERRLTHRDGFNSGADASAPGRPILFHGREGEWRELFSVEPATGAVKRLTVDEREDWQPAWTEDGTEIVWCAGQPRNDYDVWAMKADGSGARPLVTGPGRDEYPVPRPKGAKGGPCSIPAKPPSGGSGANP